MRLHTYNLVCKADEILHDMDIQSKSLDQLLDARAPYKLNDVYDSVNKFFVYAPLRLSFGLAASTSNLPEF